MWQDLLKIPFHPIKSHRDFLQKQIETVRKVKFLVRQNNTYYTHKIQKEYLCITVDLLPELTKSMHK